jgi:hypothetical protein
MLPSNNSISNPFLKMQFQDVILRPVIKGSTFMSVLDMASGFYQVGVRVMAFNEFQQYFSYIMASVLLVEETEN